MATDAVCQQLCLILAVFPIILTMLLYALAMGFQEDPLTSGIITGLIVGLISGAMTRALYGFFEDDA